MILAAAAYIAGLFFALFFTLPAVLMLIPAAAGVYFIGRYCGLKPVDFIITGAVFVLAAGYMTAYTSLKYTPVTAYDGTTGSFSGEITDMRRYSGGKAQYTLKGRINGSQLARITVYTDELYADYGDTVSIESCTFAVPEGDYLYDSTDRLRSEGIFLTADDAEGVSISHNDSHSLKRRLIAYREKMCSRFADEMGAENGEFLAGMVFGQTSGIDSDTRVSLSRCGIAHMLAVSGLHVSIAAFLFMELLKKLRMHRIIAYGLLNVFLAAITVMADSPVSAVRAAIMLDIMYAAGLFRRQNDTFNALAAAVLLICTVNPYAVFSSGFWLSVTGTFGIGVAAPYFIQPMPSDKLVWKLACGFTAMLCTSLCIMPLSMLYFDETSLISPVMNVFVVPLCTAALIAGLIYVFTGGIVSLLTPASFLIEAVLRITGWASRLSFTHFSADEKLIRLAFLLAAAAVLVQLILRSRRVTACVTAIACCIMFVSTAVYRFDRRSRINIAVLGRGTNAAVVLSYKGHTDVIDLSGHYKSAAYVRKYLAQNHTENVDMLILTNRVHSQYSAYMGEFSHISIGDCAAPEELSLYGVEVSSTFGEEGFFCDCGGYSIRYADGILTVRCGGEDLSFISGSSGKTAGGRCIYYGKIPDGADISGEAICLDSDTNNFEAELSGDGVKNIRRLKCHTLI